MEDQSQPEVEFDDELKRFFEQELTKLRVIEWLNEMTTDPKEADLTKQYRGSLKYLKSESLDSSLDAQEGRLRIQTSNLHLAPDGRSTGTLIVNFSASGGRTYPHWIKSNQKMKNAGETGNLEAETEKCSEKSDISRVLKSYFGFPNEYSSIIVLTEGDFILTEGTCAITADMSFRTVLAADFSREYKSIELLWKQRPGVGGVVALPPAASRAPGK